MLLLLLLLLLPLLPTGRAELQGGRNHEFANA
jgi:hypothetical protein